MHKELEWIVNMNCYNETAVWLEFVKYSHLYDKDSVYIIERAELDMSFNIYKII